VEAIPTLESAADVEENPEVSPVLRLSIKQLRQHQLEGDDG
jgi:hypothetical protein